MANTRYCKKSDLERAVGGAAVLIELLDKNQDNVADDNLVVDCIDAGCNEIASYIQLAVDLDSIGDPFPLSLVFKSADAAAFFAWVKGSDRQAAPPAIADAYAAAIRWAQDVGARRAALGVTPKPKLDPPAAYQNTDPDGHAVSIEGFKRGFR